MNKVSEKVLKLQKLDELVDTILFWNGRISMRGVCAKHELSELEINSMLDDYSDQLEHGFWPTARVKQITQTDQKLKFREAFKQFKIFNQ